MNSGLGQNALVTGASRGIGFAFVEHLLKNSNINKVFAGCRDPDSAKVKIIAKKIFIFRICWH